MGKKLYVSQNLDKTNSNLELIIKPEKQFGLWKKFQGCENGPNYQLDDVWQVFKLLNPIHRFDRDESLARDYFGEYLGVDKNIVFFADSGRTALYLLLKSLDLPKNSEILIQSFSCVVLPNSIWQAGYKVRLVDTNEEDYNLSLEDLKQKINPNSKVLIIQYTYGIVPKKIKEIVDFCIRNNLILIEDCAHSLGAEIDLDGTTYKAGNLGDCSIFSFGRDKIVSTTIGGAGYINTTSIINQKRLYKIDHQKWQNKLDTEYAKLPKMSFRRLFQSLFYVILTTLIARPFYHIQIGKLATLFAIKIGLIGRVYTSQEKFGTSELETASLYPKRLFVLLANQIKKIDLLNQHRRDKAHEYASKLGLEFDPRSVYLRYPIDLKKLTDSQDYKTSYQLLRQKYRSRGIFVGTWYTSLFMQDKMDYQTLFEYQAGDLPVSESLCNQRVLNLPTNIHLK